MFSSLRARLWLTYALVVGLILVFVAVWVIFLARTPVLGEANQKLRIALAALHRGATLAEPTPERMKTVALRIDEEFDVRVLLMRKEEGIFFDTQAEISSAFLLPPPPPSPPQDEERPPTQFLQDKDGDSWMYLSRPIVDEMVLMVATPRPRLQVLTLLRGDLFRPLLWTGLVALLFSLLLAFLMSRWVAAPLHRMARSARTVAKGMYRPIPLEGPDEVRSLARTLNEMSSRVQSSQQSQRDFVANVSHELKTPLTSIQGFAQAILDGTADTPLERQKAAQVVYDEAGRMHRLVLDLLDLARLDAGTADLELAECDLSLLLRATVEKFAPQAAQAKIKLTSQIDTLPSFIGAGDRLAQVFTNLVDNALKHTPSGGEVSVRAIHNSGWMEVSVADSGSGIPPEELDRIFERFYQMDKARSGGAGRGVGLGLAIARQIVQAHGGAISATSQVGQGSVFMVKLPVARSDDTTLITKRKK